MFHDRAFERDFSFLNQIETVRWFAGAENYFPGRESFSLCIAGEQLEVIGAHSRQERMSGDIFPDFTFDDGGGGAFHYFIRNLSRCGILRAAW